jgi:hypothetical protein
MRSYEKIFREKAKELGKFSPPVKLDPKAVIKGKVAIVQQQYAHVEFMWRSHSVNGDVILDIEKFGLTKDRVTNKPEEIDTLIQIICQTGGASGGVYTTNTGKTVSTTSSYCNVNVIDYKNSAIIAQKRIDVNMNNLGDKIVVREGASTSDFGVPTKEVEDYIKNFPKN